MALHGEVVVHRAYGAADRGERQPMTTGTAVGIASATKQFSAAAALRLAQEGRLSLEDPIDRWLEAVPEEKRAITIDQLLTHTAGVRVGLAEDFEAASLEEQVAAILAAPPTGPPGEEWRYSNGGYILAAAIVQAAAGVPFAEYLRETLFEPAGMRRTGFLHAPVAGPVARAYVGWEEKGAPGEWRANWRAFGSGDMVTTAADLWRWDLALREGRILEGEWLDRYFAGQVDAGGGAGYAYGLFVHDGERGAVVEHGGDTRLGYNAGFFRYLDRDAVLIVLSNSALSPARWMRHTLSRELEAILFGEDPGHEPPRARLPTREEAGRLAGTWATAGTGAIHLIDDGFYLWAVPEGQQATGLLDGRDTTGYEIAASNRRTGELLQGLLSGKPEAYPLALQEDGLPHLEGYIEEWEGLAATLGPFERYDVLGSVPFRADVKTTARIRFRDGDVAMTYFWSDSGRGRLHGTRAEAGAGFPVATPVAIAPDGSLVFHDPWEETTARARLADGTRLEFESGTVAERRGHVAWTP